ERQIGCRKAGTPLDENDLWIAATTLSLSAVLVTTDHLTSIERGSFQAVQHVPIVEDMPEVIILPELWRKPAWPFQKLCIASSTGITGTVVNGPRTGTIHLLSARSL